MGSIVLSTVLLVVTGWCGDRPLDKTGTGPSKTWCLNEKTLEIQGFSEARSFDAEWAGFEPAEQFYPFAALAKRCFRPLSHLSR